MLLLNQHIAKGATKDQVQKIYSDMKYKQKVFLTTSFMTFKVIVAIHYEAFKLWLKGIKFIKKKLKIKNNISEENNEFK